MTLPPCFKTRRIQQDLGVAGAVQVLCAYYATANLHGAVPLFWSAAKRQRVTIAVSPIEKAGQLRGKLADRAHGTG